MKRYRKKQNLGFLPLAKALIGKEVGDIAEYTAPGRQKIF
jgi:transcription elongation GreA/GreB family factor